MIDILVLLLSFSLLLLCFFFNRVERWDSGFAVSKFDHSTTHRNSSSTQQKTAFWKGTVSECYLLCWTLFSSLILESVNLNTIFLKLIQIFLNYWVFYEIGAFSSGAVMKRQQQKQLTKKRSPAIMLNKCSQKCKPISLQTGWVPAPISY